MPANADVPGISILCYGILNQHTCLGAYSVDKIGSTGVVLNPSGLQTKSLPITLAKVLVG